MEWFPQITQNGHSRDLPGAVHPSAQRPIFPQIWRGFRFLASQSTAESQIARINDPGKGVSLGIGGMMIGLAISVFCDASCMPSRAAPVAVTFAAGAASRRAAIKNLDAAPGTTAIC